MAANASGTSQWRESTLRELELRFIQSRRGTNTINGAASLSRRGTDVSIGSNVQLMHPASSGRTEERGLAPAVAAPASEPVSTTAAPAPPATNDFQKLWTAVSSMRLVAVLSFILALVVGIGTWLGTDRSNKWSKGSYDIAFLQLCESELHRLDPNCQEVIARGVGGVALHERSVTSESSESSAFGGLFWMKDVATQLEKSMDLPGDFRSKYAQALAFRNLVLFGTLAKLEGHLNKTYDGEQPAYLAEAASLLDSLMEARNISLYLYRKLTSDAVRHQYECYTPLQSVEVGEVVTEMLYMQYETVELLRTYLDNVIWDNTKTVGIHSRQANSFTSQYAMRHFLTAEELLVRAGSSSRFPLPIKETGWLIQSVSYDMDVLLSTVAEERRPMVSRWVLIEAIALRGLRIWLAFELGVAPIAHFVLADVYASYFLSYYKRYIQALPAISVALCLIPAFRRRLPGLRVLWPILWFWGFSFLRYRNPRQLGGKVGFNGSLNPRSEPRPESTYFGYCKFLFQTSKLADTTPKLAFLLATLDALYHDNPGPSMSIATKIGQLILHPTGISQAHIRSKRLGYALCGVLCLYGIWLQVRIQAILLPPPNERLGNFKVLASDFLDNQVILTWLTIIASSMFVAFRLGKPMVGIALIVSAWERTPNFPLERGYVKCDRRFYDGDMTSLPEDLGVDVPLILCFFLLVAIPPIRRASQRIVTRLKAL